MSKPKPDITNILHENNQYYAKTRRFFIWMPINVILLSLVVQDIWKNHRTNTVVIVLLHVIAVILSLNILYLCCQRFLMQYFQKKYNFSFEQLNILRNFNNQILLGKYHINVADNQATNTEKKAEKIYFERFRASSSSLFATSSQSVKPEYLNDGVNVDRFPMKHYQASSSIFAGTPIFTDSSHDASNDRFLGLSGNYESFSNPTIGSSNLSKSFSSFSKNDFTDEVDSLRRYSEGVQNLSGTTDASGYWRSRDNMMLWSQNMQRSDLVLNDIYQLAPTSALEYVKPVNEVSSLGANPKLCKKFGINQSYLSDWIANLRMWITQTILTRIIKEIKDVNISMTTHGVTNVSIGSSGLERLRKAAAMSHICQNIPSFSSLISFLDISANQEYVVQRISALSTGSMSNYCWNSGGTYEGKPWNETLPTDAAYIGDELIPVWLRMLICYVRYYMYRKDYLANKKKREDK